MSSEYKHSSTSFQNNVFITENDILCGRGGLSNKHPGNILFRRLVRVNKPIYRRTISSDYKQLLVTSIITAIQRHKRRFVRKQGGAWVEISHREACLKTSQALREQDALSDSSETTSYISSSSNSKASPCQHINDKKRARPPMSSPMLVVPYAVDIRNSMDIVPSDLATTVERDADMDNSQHYTAEVAIQCTDNFAPIKLSDDVELFPPELDDILRTIMDADFLLPC